MVVWDEIDEINKLRYWDGVNKLAQRMYEDNREKNNGEFSAENKYYFELVCKLYGTIDRKLTKTIYYYDKLVDYIEINGKHYAVDAFADSIIKTTQNYNYEANDNFKNYFFNYLKTANKYFHSDSVRKFMEDIASEMLKITKTELKKRRGDKSLIDYMKELRRYEEFKERLNEYGIVYPNENGDDGKPQPLEPGEPDPEIDRIEEPYIVILADIIRPLSGFAVSMNVSDDDRKRFQLIYSHDSIGTILTEGSLVYVPHRYKLLRVLDETYRIYLYTEDKWNTIEKISDENNLKSGVATTKHRKILGMVNENGTFIQDTEMGRFLGINPSSIGPTISRYRKKYEKYIKPILQEIYS